VADAVQHRQHPRLPEPVHQPSLRDGTERVGEPERARDAPRLREGARRLAAEQQDREAEHADRQRAEHRRGDRSARPREREDGAVALQPV